MLATVNTCALLGVDAFSIRVEVDVAQGLPVMKIVGLPDNAVKESKDRVFTAIRNSGFEFPGHRVTVNLAPADVRKEGSAYDLGIALGILAASSQADPDRLKDLVVLGELALNGRIKRVNGVLSAALSIRGQGLRLLLPEANANEGAIVEGLESLPVRTLQDAVAYLNGGEIKPVALAEPPQVSKQYEGLDYKDVKGQAQARRALEIAAAGAHNGLLIGPPGSGKTMLARRLPTILPPMALEESIETTKIYSVSGMLKGGRGLVRERPFRQPHHSISNVGMIGGGAFPKPGEVSLAHNGVLFLDEMPEFTRAGLEMLRQPLEDGEVCISRAQASLTYPARFMLIGAMNPCPCGFLTDPTHKCTCSTMSVSRYMNRLSGPLLDRMDLHVEVPSLAYEELTTSNTSESSGTMRERVLRARVVQTLRFAGRPIHANAQMGPRELREYCTLDRECLEVLRQAVDRLGLSARAYDRVLKVARTIADLSGEGPLRSVHVAEAIGYRVLDRRRAGWDG